MILSEEPDLLGDKKSEFSPMNAPVNYVKSSGPSARNAVPRRTNCLTYREDKGHYMEKTL